MALLVADSTGRVKAADWARYEKVGLEPDLDLDDLVLNWTDRKIADLEAKGALVSVQMERTMDGASTVTVVLRDPRHHLFAAGRTVPRARRKGPVAVDQGWDPIMPPGVVGKAMEISLDGVVFRLVKVSYSTATDEATLTFEDRLVYWLRRKSGEKRASRGSITRAQFILALLREVRARQYRYVCPSLSVRQPIDKGAKASTTATTKASTATANVPAKLGKTYPAHRIGAAGAARLSEREVRIACELAGMNPTDALHMAQISHGESDFFPGVVQDDPGDGMVGTGLFQFTPHAWGGTNNPTFRHMASLGGLSAMRNPMQAARMAKWMFDQSGLRPWYGTRYLDRSSKASKSVLPEGMSADTVLTDEGAAGKSYTKSYQFTRNADEDSWTAMQRLADEVNWRCFVVGNSLYYMSETELYGRRVRYLLEPDDPAVLDFSWEVDWGKPISEATVDVALERWGAPPGSVIEVDGFGPPDGRWLVESISRDWFSPHATVTIKQPGKAKLEPAAEQASPQGGGGESGLSEVTANTASGKVKQASKQISDKGYPYVWGGGHSRIGTPDRGTGRDPGIGMDCSGSVCAALGAAALGYKTGGQADVSGTIAQNWGDPGQGQGFTVWANGQHVWIEFADGSRFDTSPYGSGARGPRVRSTKRPTTGFTARHWPGT